MDTRQGVIVAASVVAAATVYVLVHEARRKKKKTERAKLDQPISKALLLEILNESAAKSKPIIDQIRMEVAKIASARNMQPAQANQLFQQNFEHQLDKLIAAIRKLKGVTETAMDASFKEHQGQPEIQQAIQNMRLMSAPAGEAGSSSAAAPVASSAAIPDFLTKAKLKEIMQFNADLLESELAPIKAEMAKIRKEVKEPQIDPAQLMQLQARISHQVQTVHNVNDEQVMAAVEKYGAKNDPAFTKILEKIASTLQDFSP